MRVYTGREDSVGVSLCAQGRDAVLNSLDAWQMQSIYRPTYSDDDTGWSLVWRDPFPPGARVESSPSRVQSQ